MTTKSCRLCRPIRFRSAQPAFPKKDKAGDPTTSGLKETVKAGLNTFDHDLK
jgi:hypothetical protein